MNFLDKLHQDLDNWHLLKHPLYQAWSAGCLSIDTLRAYAMEYYHHVAAFPRYLSSIHSLCPDIKARQVLLANLIDEEQGDENHPELWQRFAAGLGVARPSLAQASSNASTAKLVDGYFDLTKADYATGLGALYAYERQTPEVAKSKIAGLEQHYNIHDAETLKFFSVHMQADEWHTKEVADLILALSPAEQAKIAVAALSGAKLLWEFLDQFVDEQGMHEYH